MYVLIILNEILLLKLMMLYICVIIKFRAIILHKRLEIATSSDYNK
jgi:hypothetical protein